MDPGMPVTFHNGFVASSAAPRTDTAIVAKRERAARMVSYLQSHVEIRSYEELKVDIRIEIAHMHAIDICLLNFGYRAFGTAP